MAPEPQPIGAMLGAGREAEVYAWADDAVLKLYRPGFGGHHTESVVLTALAAHRIAPTLIDVITHDDRAGLIQQRLPGSDLLTVLQRRPWRMRGLARVLAGTHRAVHDVPAPAGLPDLRAVLAHRIDEADLPAPLRGYAARVLATLPDGDRLCHGDYHPGNVLVTGDGRGRVIDWPNATRGVPVADHARTMLLLRQADPLPGTPVLSRALMATGRVLFARAYAHAYRAGLPLSPRQVAPWLVVHTAARLAEGIAVERDRLLRRLDQARRRAER